MNFFHRKKKNDGAFLIVGLGNFGDKYRNTRHNAGFIAADALAETYDLHFTRHKCHAAVATGSIGEKKIILAKPLTYMNKSGEAVAALMHFYKIPSERVVIIYDDIDIPEGSLRIRPSGSAGTHNGMRSVVADMGTEEFPRIRVGVGAKPPGGDLIKHVMGEITPCAVDAAKRAAEAACDLVENGTEHAMTAYNGRKKSL